MAYKEFNLDSVYFVNAFLIVRNGNKDLIDEQGDAGAFTYKNISASDKDKFIFRYSVFNTSAYTANREILQSFEVEAYPNITLDEIDEGVFYLTDDLATTRISINDDLYDQSYGIRSGLDHAPVGYLYRDSDGELHNIVASDLICPVVEVGYTGTTSGTTEISIESLYNYSSITDALGEAYSTTKIFKTLRGATKYLETGNDEDDVNNSGDLSEDREVTLYYESDIFSRAYNSSTSTHIGASTIHFRVQYKNNKGEEIVNPYRAICGYVANNNVPNDSNRFGNIVWIANNNINLIETKQQPVNGSIAPSRTIPNYNHTTGFYPPYIDNNTIYDARYRTNMRIFANQQDAIDFLGGGNPTPIGESGNQFNPNGFIGDKTVFNDGHDMAGGGMSSCWIMNESQLEDLANVFTTGLTKVEEQNGDLVINITKTCARAFASHGEPIDAVVDLFWIPFDPSEFVITGASSFMLSQDDLSSATSLLKITAQSGDVVKAHGTRSFGESKEFVGSVVGSMGNMFSSTTQKVQNVGN